MSERPNQQNPYDILKVPRNASQSQIKSAYRKLALKFHPDRHQGTEKEKRQYTEMFAKIGNAYEILGDAKRRENFDKYGIDADSSGSSNQKNNYNRNQHGQRDPFSSQFFEDPFFSQGGVFQRDPFQIFQDFFGEEVNSGFRDNDFESPFHNGGFNMDHPSGMGGFGDSFSRFGGIHNHMNMMNNMMNAQSSSFQTNGGMPGRQAQTSYYSSASTSYGGGNNAGGIQQSVSTSTRIINGKRQTIRETVKVMPDGSVERTTETSGDDEFNAMLGQDSRNQAYLQDADHQKMMTQDSSQQTKRFFGRK